MKNVFLLLAASSAFNLSAQISLDSLFDPTDSITIDYHNKMEFYFEDLDLTEVEGGVLYDRGFPFLDLEPYDGSVNSENKATFFTFNLAYASLFGMDTEGNLPDPDLYTTKVRSQSNESETINLFALHQQYYKIDSNAVANNLLTVTNGKFQDVFPRTVSPYKKHDAFMVVPSMHKVKHLQFSFLLESTFFYSNTGKTIQSIEINNGDGLGYRIASLDTPFFCTYEEEGLKTVSVRMTYTDASVFVGYFDMLVESAGNRNGDLNFDLSYHIDPIGSGLTDEGRGGGDIHVYFACGHTKIEKPFIWAEAFNPEVGLIHQLSLTPQKIVERMSMGETELNDKLLWDYLIDEGYDIIILDYDNGGDFLPRTAEFIKEALRWINEQKEEAYSNEKNIILGQSMGGVATNLALREMELDGENHDVSTLLFLTVLLWV